MAIIEEIIKIIVLMLPSLWFWWVIVNYRYDGTTRWVYKCSSCKKIKFKLYVYFHPTKNDFIIRHIPFLHNHEYLCKPCLRKQMVVNRLEGRTGNYCPYCNLDYNTNKEIRTKYKHLHWEITEACLGCKRKIDKK